MLNSWKMYGFIVGEKIIKSQQGDVFSTAVNNSKIKSFGYVKLPLDFKLTNAASGLL